jgi:hypothetical protein
MAADLGVSRDTLYEWERVHPEFADALGLARVHVQAYWEDIAQEAIGKRPRECDARLWARIAGSRFADYRKRQSVALNRAPALFLTAINVKLQPEEAYRQMIEEATLS